MNKVFNINLGGYAFTIDEDAFRHLEKYLDAIHAHFRSSEGFEEIVSDIETRLAELFQENLSGRPIVTMKDVKNAISIMGTPEEFGAEPIDETTAESSPGEQSKSKHSDKSYRTGKRLFRNPEDEVIGGVCSGIAAYFGIHDPLWIRLTFIVITLSGGFGIPAYLILWTILPKAETAGDRLAMRGESINVSNIGRIIEEEIEQLSGKVSNLGDDLDKKWSSKKKDTPKQTATQKRKLERPLPGGYML